MPADADGAPFTVTQAPELAKNALFSPFGGVVALRHGTLLELSYEANDDGPPLTEDELELVRLALERIDA